MKSWASPSPYPRSLIASLNTAALRGVEVEILLPERNNLPYVGWASRAYHWELLQYGTRIYYQPSRLNDKSPAAIRCRAFDSGKL
jgi:phosphatidylserine/phosphatidylglycerophosphate/cardiolipin synthase-like enzyme